MVTEITRLTLFALLAASALPLAAAQIAATPPSLTTPATKVKHILSFVRAKAPPVAGGKVALAEIMGVSDIPDRMHVCASPWLRDQDCKVDRTADEFRMAYASQEKNQELDVLVLAHRTFTEGYFYLVSPQGTLKKAVHPKKFMNRDVEYLALDVHDQLVLRDFQEQLDFWNDKYEEWVLKEKKP